MNAFPHLLSPLEIKGIVLRNRIFSTGHETLIVRGGIPDEHLAAYHEARARGGAGLIITEATTVHETAFFNAAMPVGYLENCIPGFRLVADAIHRHGARVFGQLFHPGGEMMGMVDDGTRPVAWAPSAYNHERYLIRSREMPDDLVESVIAGYAATAANLVAAGYDGVEIVASHGYLPAQFLSARINRREDRWGGSPRNRQRFLMEIGRAVRAAVPAEIVLGMRISLNEKIPDGVNDEEALGVIAAMRDAGLLDYVNLTIGASATSFGNDHVIPPMTRPAGFMIGEAGDTRASLGLPMFLAGRFNQPQAAEEALA
jgi:2,4-dienoyl-CoA reductase-like NADH-dependent reductase (Old Yellow Enzyme family)